METDNFDELVRNFARSNEQLEEALSIIGEYSKKLSEYRNANLILSQQLDQLDCIKDTRSNMEVTSDILKDMQTRIGEVADTSCAILTEVQKLKKIIAVILKENRDAQRQNAEMLNRILQYVTVIDGKVTLNYDKNLELGEFDAQDALINELLGEE